MSIVKKVPEIRFEGFSEEWEKKAFGDCFVDIPNNTLSRADLNYKTGLAKNIHYGDILIKFGEVLDACNEPLPFITNNDVANKLKHAALRDGDIIIADAAEDSIVGKCTELFNIDEQLILSGLHTIAVRPTLSFASKYLGYYLNSSSFHDQLLSLMQGTKVLSISKTAIRNTNVTFPRSSEEQAQIGNYFQKLDELINQHKQKHDKLNNIKKAMLEKMFPKQGETMPEIRFKGFSGEWAEIKFSEMFNEKDGIRRGPFGGSIKKEMFVAKSDYVVYEQRNAIYDRYDTRYNISREKYQELINFSLASGDFIMSGAGTIGRVSRVPDGVKIGVFNQAIIRMRINDERIDSEFFLQWIRSEKMQERLTESNPASAMVNLVPMNELKAWDVLIPNKKEQSTIGNYFQKLDILINRHHQQITKLNNIKQACLSKMFV